MFKLDNNFLVTMGLGNLPVDEKNRLLQMIYERLEMNVGMRLAEKMTDAQLDEFESFIDRNDEAGALKWLESNFPNYKDVVSEELEKLKGEVQAAAPQIISAASQATPQANAGVAPQATPGMPPIAQEPVMPPAAAYQPTPEPAAAPVSSYSAPAAPFTPAPAQPAPMPAPEPAQAASFSSFGPSSPVSSPTATDYSTQPPAQPAPAQTWQPVQQPSTPQPWTPPVPKTDTQTQQTSPTNPGFTSPPAGFSPDQQQPL